MVNKKFGVVLGLLLFLSVLQFSLVLAESGSGSGGDDDDDSEDGNEIETELEIEEDDDKIKIEEKARIGNVKREIKREIVNGRIKEEIKEEFKDERGEFRQEVKQEIRTILAGDREKRIIEFKAKIRTQNGTFKFENKTIMIKELSDADKEIIAGKINAKTGLNLSAEDIGNGSRGSILRAYLSNGRYAEIRILPDRAAQVAADRLRLKCEERNCTVELKEVGQGNKSEARYTIEADKESRALGIFKAKMKVRAEIDPETGEVILIKKPWWAFLASEKDEDDEDSEIEIEIGGQTTEVDVDYNGIEQEFVLNTTDRSEIIAEIASRLEISAEDVETVAEFETDDDSEDEDEDFDDEVEEDEETEGETQVNVSLNITVSTNATNRVV